MQSYFGKLFRQCSDLTETFLKLFNNITYKTLRVVFYIVLKKTLLLVY
jgi:hypothetical protein